MEARTNFLLPLRPQIQNLSHKTPKADLMFSESFKTKYIRLKNISKLKSLLKKLRQSKQLQRSHLTHLKETRHIFSQCSKTFLIKPTRQHCAVRTARRYHPTLKALWTTQSNARRNTKNGKSWQRRQRKPRRKKLKRNRKSPKSSRMLKEL